jgi:hypothetical protein
MCCAPPVSFQAIQLSTVPAHTSSSGRSSKWSSNQRSLLAENAELIHKPVAARTSASEITGSRLRQISTVRRHCQLMHGPSGRPVRRSQRRTDSRWLLTPTASTLHPRGSWARQALRVCSTDRQSSSASYSTHPDRGCARRTEEDASPRHVPSSEMAIDLVLEDP